MKRAVNLVTLILQAVSAVGLFIPGSFNEDYWESTSWGHYQKAYTVSTSFLFGSGNSGGFLRWLTLLLILVGIVALILVLCSQSNLIIRLGLFAPSAGLVSILLVTIIRCITCVEDVNGHWYTQMGWMLYIIFVLQVATAILSALLALNKFRETAPASNNSSSVDSTASLWELKKLLDAGIITQEEFNIKKEKILHL